MSQDSVGAPASSDDAHFEDVEIFSTCPQSSDWSASSYARRVAEVARWSERHGCRGILVYTDNRLVDPWLVSQIIMQHTERLAPLVAVQPIYMHPYTAAKMVASLGHLYRRRMYLNMVAGGFKNDLVALDDSTPHDRRYDRLVEYTRIVMRLLAGAGPVTQEGEFYRVVDLALAPTLAPELFPGVFVSGSSEAGAEAARALDATAVLYPKASREEPGPHHAGVARAGIRVGVIARRHEAEAWQVAHERFPEDRKGQLAHELAMRVSDSVWHHELSRAGEAPPGERDPYWLVPFKNYQTFCPYLVGSYATVAAELGRYVALGYRTFILDIPPAEEELGHVMEAFRLAARERRA
jgi:alkanesulfonate monooxygenase